MGYLGLFVAQMADPFFAAATVGVAMHVDGDQVGGLGEGGGEKGAKQGQSQWVFHGLALDEGEAIGSEAIMTTSSQASRAATGHVA